MTPAETPTECAEFNWGKVSLTVHHADLHAEIESLKESAFLASKRAVKAETIVADLAWFYRVIQAGTEVAHVERGSKLNLSPSEVAGLRRALESIAAKDARIRELVAQVQDGLDSWPAFGLTNGQRQWRLQAKAALARSEEKP